MSRVEKLKKFPLFEEWSKNPKATQAFSSFAEELIEKSYRQGDVIIREGEMGSELFFLMSGKVEVYKLTPEGEPYKVAKVSADTHPFFGEGALIDTEARSATIIAEAPSHCLVLDRASFHSFASKHPEWAFTLLERIARSVLGKLRKSNDDLMLLYHALLDEIRGS